MVHDDVCDLDTVKRRTPRQRYASWAASTAGQEARAHMYRRQLGICLCCTKPISLGEAEIDHYIPIKDGCDPLDESNMYIVCRSCNRKKGPRKAIYKIAVDQEEEEVPKSGTTCLPQTIPLPS